MIKIADLVQGDKVRLLSFGDTDISYRRSLLSRGITCGVTISILRIAPLGCPVLLDVRGTSLTLRVDEARYLQWERI